MYICIYIYYCKYIYICHKHVIYHLNLEILCFEVTSQMDQDRRVEVILKGLGIVD